MNKYTQASINLREKDRNKMRMNNKGIGDHGIMFQKLTQVVPNWETYLTDKQLEVAKLYLQHMSCYAVDDILKVRPGITHDRLFRVTDEDYNCGLKRLQIAYKKLKDDGYYERLKKRQELIRNNVK